MAFKLILTFCVTFAAVRSFPFNENRRDQDRLLRFRDVQQDFQTDFLWNSTNQLNIDESSVDAQVLNFRLPNGSIPLRTVQRDAILAHKKKKRPGEI
jgi:hypothetical protein